VRVLAAGVRRSASAAEFTELMDSGHRQHDDDSLSFANAVVRTRCHGDVRR